MKFSFVVPLYNKGPYVEAAIASILAQTYPDLEIIVVDDGSSDDGPARIEKLRDPRVILVRQQNAGVSAARNHGINVARGEWVTFLDADDGLHPEYLAHLLKAEQAFPEADVLGSGFFAVPDGNIPASWSLPQQPVDIELIHDLPKRWMQGPTLNSSSVAVRRARLQNMQPCFPLGEASGEDLDLWFRLAEQTPIALVKAPLSAYRLGVPDSLSRQHRAAPRRLLHTFERMRQRAHSGALTGASKRSALMLVAQCEVTLAREAIAGSARLEALRWLADGAYAMRSKRWWVTAAMALFLSARLTRRWQQWRQRRLASSAEHLDMA